MADRKLDSGNKEFVEYGGGRRSSLASLGTLVQVDAQVVTDDASWFIVHLLVKQALHKV